MEIVIGFATKVAEYTVGPIVRPIGHHIVRPMARPFINLWEYKSNLENLKKEVEKLEAEGVRVQGLTPNGVEPLPDVKLWQDKVTNIINEVSGLTSQHNPQQQSMKCCKGCTYSNLKECYQHRNNVARKLKDVAQLLQEAMKSKSLWEYKSNLENLKKEVEKLEARREGVQHLIKDGEEPLQHVKLWQDNVNKIIDDYNNLRQQNMQCCNGLICSNLDICNQCRNNVARMLEGVAKLLQEARDFREVSTISEETVYKSNLEKLKKEVEKLEVKRDSVKCSIKVGEEPLPDVKLWQDKVNNIINEVSGLRSQHNPQQQNNVARILEDVAQLLQEAMKSTSLWKYKSNLENLNKEVEKLVARRESVQRLIKVGDEPLPHVKVWQESVDSIINEVSGLVNANNPEHQNNVARKLKDVAQLMQEAREFREVSTTSEETVYKINLENLNKDLETLKLKRESLQRLIKVGEEPLPDVKVWQDRVKKIIDEVPGLTIEHNPEHQNKVAQLLKEIVQLLQESVQFREVSCPSIPEQPCLQPSTQQEFSESRVSILKDIIAALTKADVNMVGIYGMGGVGKTTLAKKVGSQAMQNKLFDKIVFVEVSQSPNIKTIQEVIADYLGLKFEEVSISGRAGKLCSELKKVEKKVLIILDNLWKEIKLEEDVGIPVGNNCKGLKLLLTARSHDVLTKRMKSQPNFHVKTLSEEDAWTLFKSTAGTCVDRPHLNSVALQVAKKCGGMPLAVVTVATALKDAEAKEEWNDALQRLDHPSLESFEGITEEVYSSIKLSYDYLREERVKEIFLLCSRMGCTYNASVQDLFRYGLGLGFFNFKTVEDALCTLCTSVNKLKAASLLLDAPKTQAFAHHDIPDWERFAIHDVICDVARSIASKEQHVFTGLDGHIPWSLTNKESLQNCTSITLYNIDELSKNLELVCPNIKFLYMEPKNSYFTIPDNFFIEMSSLQVLHLILIYLNPPPSSLSCLVNLQALCLDRCKFGDIVAIGGMNKLEVLSLCRSDITMLPKEMCQLTKLRLLDLTNCYDLSVIPSKVMSSLTGIEALYMNNTSIKWEDARPSIDELKHLHRLTTLEIDIPESKMFRGLISSEPKRYKICIGDFTYDWQDWKPYCTISRRFLRLQLDTKEDWIISQLPGVEELELEGDVVGAMNLLDDLDRNGFPQLMYLHVSANNHCVCIVNCVSCAVLPSLESLMVEHMGSLEKICNSPLGADSFLILKTIHVENCYKLSNIFCFFSIVRVLPNLTDLEVFDCDNMEEIFSIEEQDDGNSTEVVHDIKFSQLSYLRLRNLPKLKSFCRKAKTASPLQLASYTSASQISSAKELNNHSWLFNEKVVTPNLQDLSVDTIPQIEQIWHSLLSPLFSCVQNLTKLRVLGCDNLKVLLSSSTAISEESRGKERRDTIVFPKLNHLWMEDLTKLTRLCSGYNIEFPSLEEFYIRSCRQLEEFIFDESVKVPKLKELRIFDMNNLKMIWNSKLTEDSFSKLKSLAVTKCHKLLTLFPSNMCGRLLSLESLNVDHCHSLVQLCDIQGINSEEYEHVPFMNLQELKVLGCPSPKYIFAKEGVAANEVPTKFVFPKLTSLKLKHLPKLGTFYPGKHTVEGPIVKRLKLYDCGIHYTDEEGQTQQPLYLVQQPVFPCLEELELTGKQLTMMGQVQVPEYLFHKLKILHVQEHESTVFPPGIIQRCQNLENLSVTGPTFFYGDDQTQAGSHKETFFYGEYQTQAGSCKEIFFCGEDQTQAAPRAKVKTLVLQDLRDMKYMWEQDSIWDSIFQNLEVLRVDKCISLVNLMLPSASLQNLTILNVWNCHSLETIVTFSMAKSLMKLKKMSISFCLKVTEVIQNQGDVTGRIIFSNLKTLELRGMYFLTSFCSCSFTLEFPSLEEFNVCDGWNMKTFSQGDLTMPKLQEVRINKESFRLRPDTNLNTIILQFHEKRYPRKINQSCSSSQHME